MKPVFGSRNPAAVPLLVGKVVPKAFGIGAAQPLVHTTFIDVPVAVIPVVPANRLAFTAGTATAAGAEPKLTTAVVPRFTPAVCVVFIVQGPFDCVTPPMVFPPPGKDVLMVVLNVSTPGFTINAPRDVIGKSVSFAPIVRIGCAPL